MKKKPAKVAASATLIEDLVAGSRILARQGVLDGYGHISARSDKRPQHFIMSRSRAPALVTAADLMELDADSEPLAGEQRKASSSATSTARSTARGPTSWRWCTAIRLR